MDSLIGPIVIVGSFLVGVIGNLIAAELYDRALAQWIVRRAATRLSLNDRERYREEWLSHLEDCDGKITQIMHAVGIDAAFVCAVFRQSG
jgi:hypothetical protein